jgi:hypothetical protein
MKLLENERSTYVMTFNRFSLIASIATSAFLPVASPAAAALPYVSLGPTLLSSDPACVAEEIGTALCAAAGPGGIAMFDRYAAGRWSGWKSLGIAIDGKPSCTRGVAGSTLCGMRDAENRLVAERFNGTSWTRTLVGGTLSSDTSCAGLASDRAVCAALDAAGDIVAAVSNGNAWKWVPTLAAIAVSPISCTPDDNGHAICAWTGSQNNVMAAEFDGTAWDAPLDLGGRATGTPACNASGLGASVVCYVTGPDSGLYYTIFTGLAWSAGNWTGWSAAGGSLTGAACAENGASSAKVNDACVATGVPGGALWYLSPAGWATAGGGPVIGTPACVTLDPSAKPARVLCVVQTAANAALSIALPLPE